MTIHRTVLTRSAVALATGALLLVLLVGPAGAQSTSTSLTAPSTTAPMAIDSSAITSKGSPTHNEGLLVGGGAFAVIVIGALLLYFRHRPRTR